MNRREFLGTLAAAATSRTFAARIPAAVFQPVVVAHRGEHSHAPENSLQAIELAIRGGADYVELDVRRTRDGEHVLMHDATVDRTTTGHGPVADLDWSDIGKLRLKYGGQPDQAEMVPRLSDALPRLRGRAGLYLDFKDGAREVVARLLREAAMTERTVVYDRLGNEAAWRKVAPELPLMVSPALEDLTDQGLTRLKQRYPVEILDGPASAYTAAAVRAAQAHGFQVWLDIQGPWEGPAFWRRILALGADGLQSDKPSELVAFLRAEGRR